MKLNKINKNKNKTVPIKRGYNNLYPVFSFSQYIRNDNYFSHKDSQEERNSLLNFFDNLKDVSQFNWLHIKSNPHIFHCHEIEKDIKGLEGFESIDIIQFKIPRQKQGRIIGFFDENNVFNILLYDSKHEIYRRK